MTMLRFPFLLSLCFVASSGNQMDPHVYPHKGPFFEGWYLRVIDPSQDVSIGFLFALILPEKSSKWTNSTLKSSDPNIFRMKKDRPLVASSLLISLGDGSKLDIPSEYFDPSDYKVTKNGKPVTHNPDDASPPQFEVHISSKIKYVVTPKGTKFDINIGDHQFKGETSAPVPWGPHGQGPESWLELFPLPISWFVYSLRSNVVAYKYTNKKTKFGIQGPVDGKPAAAHLEKNWGRSFPPAWIWAEGTDPSTKVSFAFSSGVIEELGFKIPAQLSGYRNPEKDISCSFHPVNSLHVLKQDGCAGSATLMVQSLSCRVVFELQAPVESLSDCLPAPQVDGFAIGCKESYSAVANITVHQVVDGSYKLTDHQIVKMAALEFGEDYVCNKGCTP